MSKKLFVRNLPFSMTEEDLSALFSPLGGVASVKIPVDRDTGRKRGFAFVEMQNAEDAAHAADRLNGQSINGRPVYVEFARDRNAA